MNRITLLGYLLKGKLTKNSLEDTHQYQTNKGENKTDRHVQWEKMEQNIPKYYLAFLSRTHLDIHIYTMLCMMIPILRNFRFRDFTWNPIHCHHRSKDSQPA